MQSKILGNIVLSDRIIYGGCVTFEDGIITDICENAGANPDSLPYILPGLVDIHNHGAMGHDYMEATKDSFSQISGHLLRHGVTTSQATTATAPVDEIKAFLDFFRSWKTEEEPIGKYCRFSGVHIEGPYISHKNKGAHQESYLLTADDGYTWVLEYSDVIGELTVSPELSGMPKMIEDLKNAGIVSSGGHDDAEPEDIELAVEKGMTHCTHIYCAMSTLHKTGAHRKCGLCEYAMTHNEITAEMIADNHHTPPWLAKMIYNAKGADRLCLVSDAISPAGLEENSTNGQKLFELGIGEEITKVVVDNGVAMVEDKSCYAGSIQALDSMIRNMVNDCDISIVNAVKMATLTPAKIIGIAGDCGSIEVGKRADFCITDSSLNVKKTILGGNTVYEKKQA